VVANHLLDDEAQELLAEFGIELRLHGELAKARDLAAFAVGIGRGERVLRLVPANCLRNAKAFGQHVDDGGIDIVDALAISRQHGIGTVVGRGAGLGVHRRAG